MNVKKVLSQANNVLETDIPSEVLDDQFTVLGKDFGEKGTDLKDNLPNSDEGFVADLKNIFQHIVASPRNREKFQNVYAWPNNAVQEEDFEVVNRSADQASKFVNELIVKAKQHTFPDNQEFDIKDADRKFILIGERGVGKTFFLNYILSRHHTRFDESKIIYIRISLSHLVRNWTVKQRLTRQAIVIIRDYYLNERTGLSSDEFLEHLVKKGHKKPHRVLRKIRNASKSLETYIDKHGAGFDFKEQGAPKHFHQVDLEVFHLLSGYCRSKGFSFLFMVDGLDAIQPTGEYEHQLKQWMDSVQREFVSAEFAGCWLLSMRKETYLRNYLNKYEHLEHRHARHKPIMVAAGAPQDVIAQRFEDYIKIIKNRRKQQGQLILNKVHIYNYYQLLINFVSTGLGEPREKCFSVLLGLFQNDLRKLLETTNKCAQSLIIQLAKHAKIKIWEQDVSDDWLLDPLLSVYVSKYSWPSADLAFRELIATEQITKNWTNFCRRRGYEVLSAMVCGNYVFHNEPWKYSWSPEKDKYVPEHTNAELNTNAGIMPNLLGYPIDVQTQFGNIQLVRFGKLLLLAFLSWHRDPEEDLWYRERVLTEFMTGFDIPEAVTLLFLHELSHYGPIKKSFDTGDWKYCLTQSGDFCLNRLITYRDYLKDIYNSCPIPNSLVMSDSHDFIRRFKRRHGDYDKQQALQLRNMALFVRFVELSWNRAKNNLDKERLTQSKYAIRYTHALQKVEWAIKKLKANTKKTQTRQIKAAFSMNQKGFKEALIEVLT